MTQLCFQEVPTERATMHLEGGSLSLQAVGSIKRKNKSHRRQHSNNEVSSIHHTLGQPTNRIKETTDGSPVWIGKSLMFSTKH